MKKTLIVYNNYQQLADWQGVNGSPRAYRRDWLNRTKINGKFYILLQCQDYDQFRYLPIIRLRHENIVEIVWLGNTRETRHPDIVAALMLLLPSRFDPKKILPDRDMGLHGLAQFHSIAVRIRMAPNGRIKTKKAWYMFHTKKWVYESTTKEVEPVEWYADWFEEAQ